MDIFIENLKKYRRISGINLRELAKKVNVSASFLSQVENKKACPSLSVAKRIADALNTTLGYLIGEERSDPNIHVIRKNERKALVNFGEGIKLQFLSTIDKNHRMEPTIQIIEKDAISGRPPYQHIGDEFRFVLAGSIKLILNDQEFILNEGDSIYFNSNIIHSLVNVDERSAEVLFVTSPAFF